MLAFANLLARLHRMSPLRWARSAREAEPLVSAAAPPQVDVNLSGEQSVCKSMMLWMVVSALGATPESGGGACPKQDRTRVRSGLR